MSSFEIIKISSQEKCLVHSIYLKRCSHQLICYYLCVSEPCSEKGNVYTQHTHDFLSWRRLRVQCFAKMMLYKLVKKEQLIQTISKPRQLCNSPPSQPQKNHQQQWPLKKQIFSLCAVNSQLLASRGAKRHNQDTWIVCEFQDWYFSHNLLLRGPVMPYKSYRQYVIVTSFTHTQWFVKDTSWKP